ncbi:MAG: 30S ribosomal protein S16 [Roseivirga sp.]
MAVKIRLARRGRKSLALYDIIVADARAPRDGRFIEKLGNYNPNTQPATIRLKEEKALQWLLKGAQPTNTVKNILSAQGVLFRKHLQMGVNKGALTQEAADKKFAAWQQTQATKKTQSTFQKGLAVNEASLPEPSQPAPVATQEAKAAPKKAAPKPKTQKATPQPQAQEAPEAKAGSKKKVADKPQAPKAPEVTQQEEEAKPKEVTPASSSSEDKEGEKS